jgi:hypothetical protein
VANTAALMARHMLYGTVLVVLLVATAASLGVALRLASRGQVWLLLIVGQFWGVLWWNLGSFVPADVPPPRSSRPPAAGG